MVNEGRGISEINKIETLNIFNLFKGTDYDDYYNFLGEDIKVIFKMTNNYNSSFSIKNGIKILTFGYKINVDLDKIKELITHELTHMIEVIYILKKGYRLPKYDKIKKSLINFSPKTPGGEFLTHVIYKTLDNEINAIVSQTYTYLKKYNTSDVEFLKRKLNEYQVRKDYIDIINFNVNKLLSDISSNKILLDELQRLNKILITNDANDFFNFIDGTDVNMWVKLWFKIIKGKSRKLLIKQEKIIKEVIEDNNYMNNYTNEVLTNESRILKYNNYIKK
jgi:hypothetical protein